MLAAPVLLKMFGLLPPDKSPAPPIPPGAIIASSSDVLPPSMRVFTREAAPPPPVVQAVLPPPAIAFPPNGAVVPLPRPHGSSPAIQGGRRQGAAHLAGQWRAAGQFRPLRRRALYAPPGEGLARITVVDADGRSDTANVRFKALR